MGEGQGEYERLREVPRVKQKEGERKAGREVRRQGRRHEGSDGGGRRESERGRGREGGRERERERAGEREGRIIFLMFEQV